MTDRDDAGRSGPGRGDAPVDPARQAPADPEGAGPAPALREDAAPAGADALDGPRAAGELDATAGEGPDAGEARAERAAVAATAPRQVPAWALGATAVLPGAGHVATGAWVRGMAILLPWMAVMGTLFFAWERVAAVPAEGSTDDWIALVAVALTMAALWGGALWDMARARRRGAAHARGEPERRKGDSQWAIAVRHFRRNGLAMAGLAVVVILYLVAILAPFLSPYDPIAQRDLVATSFLAPSPSHPLGTDLFGRDILSRIIYGARISLSIAFIAVAIAVGLGTLLGALAGYFGGWVDTLVMRFTDMVLAFPRLVLLILIVALFSPSIPLIILVLGLTQWPGTARIVRGEVLTLREREFIHAARALGMKRARIIGRHIIPNVLAPVIVAATLGIGNTIVLEAGLSFLGFGVPPPSPSWGNMVADGRQNLLGAWWVATFPGLIIVLTVLAFNLAGDGLRDAMDPRMRQ